MSLSKEPEGEGAEDSELETDGLKEAEQTWVTGPPPFIDEAVPDSIQPGDDLEVWKASALGAEPRQNGPKTTVTCRSWKNTSMKYWTCDSLKPNWQHIVGGRDVPNSLGWFVWQVWHGNEHGFSSKRVLWTRLDVQHFTPKVQPLQNGAGPGEMDLNHAMRQQYDNLEAVEKKRGKTSQSSLSARKSQTFTLSLRVAGCDESFELCIINGVSEAQMYSANTRYRSIK